MAEKYQERIQGEVEVSVQVSNDQLSTANQCQDGEKWMTLREKCMKII
jgi:hypothetical protein